MNLYTSNSYTIDGSVVEHVTKFGDIDVYRLKSNDDEDATLYFAKGEEVLQKLYIDTGLEKGFNYINTIEFTPVGPVKR